MANPKLTLTLLDQLESVGFTDKAFLRLHHSRVRGWRAAIKAHRDYCNKVSEFQRDGDNHRVQIRLKLVLDAYRKGGFRSARERVFLALADAAFAEVPPFKGGSGELKR